MSDLTQLAATQAVVSSFMADVKDILKISIDGYAQILSLIPEEKRTDVVLAVIAANTADTASAERIATKVIDTAAVVIPAALAAKITSAERAAERSAAQRKEDRAEAALAAAASEASRKEAREASDERELLNQIKATATKRWQS